jgi:hypothetical protein
MGERWNANDKPLIFSFNHTYNRETYDLALRVDGKIVK